MACDMPEPCKFPSLDSCWKRFLWTHEEADLAQHPVVTSAPDYQQVSKLQTKASPSAGRHFNETDVVDTRHTTMTTKKSLKMTSASCVVPFIYLTTRSAQSGLVWQDV